MYYKESTRKHEFVTYAIPPEHNPKNKPFCKYCGVYLENAKNKECIERTEDYTLTTLGLVIPYNKY